MTPQTVDAECRNGHRHVYPAPAGRSVKCRTPECRVSLWLPKGRLSTAEDDADSSIWADETPWEGDASPVGEVSPEPCEDCGSDQHWTAGRTALICSHCGTVSLPATVRESAARTREAPSPSTAIALTPEQEIDALIAWESRQGQTIAVLRSAADRLKEPAAYLESADDRKNAAHTASALRTLARLASEAQDSERLDLIESKAASLASSVRWLTERLKVESQEIEYDDDDEYDDDEYEEIEPGQSVSARVADSYQIPSRFPANVSRLAIPSNNDVYRRAQQERAALRAAHIKAREDSELCQGKHRTLGLFPYQPKMQYRLWKINQQPAAGWDGYGLPTYAVGYATATTPIRVHVMDGCYSCMQKAAGDEPGYEYEKLWDGSNPSMSMVPIVLAAIVGIALLVYGANVKSNRWGYDGYGGYGSSWS